MRTLALLTGLLFYGLIIMVGCSSSSSSPPKPIDGMSPAEYREKAELKAAKPTKPQNTARAPR
jgi:hypothetical protein